MEGIEKVYAFLDDVHNYVVATVEGDQPRCRVFGTILMKDGALYIQTGKAKDVSKQLAANPKAEICAWKGATWLRIACELVDANDRELRVAMLEKQPGLKTLYDADDGNMQMLRIQNATATFSSFTDEPEVIEF